MTIVKSSITQTKHTCSLSIKMCKLTGHLVTALFTIRHYTYTFRLGRDTLKTQSESTKLFTGIVVILPW